MSKTQSALRLLPAFAAVVGFAGLCHAATYTETTDAGATLATASNTGPATGTSLTSITGSIATLVDADLFRIQITNVSTFSATTVGGTVLDTKLFLFDSAGNAVYANDDANGFVLQSTLPANNSLLTSRAPGTYFLGVSLVDNDPVNAVNQLLFQPNADTTVVNIPATGLNPTALSNFDGLSSFDENGPYTITLTGANTVAVPEPTTLAMAALGLAAIGRRRRA